MRTILLCSALAVFAVGYSVVPARADDESNAEAPKPEAPNPGARSTKDLIRDLGHLDYKVREAATKALIERGPKAKAALEEALKSEDVEVRMRAGRALRSIGAQNKQRRESKPTRASGPSKGAAIRGSHQSVSITTKDGASTVTIRTRGDDGKFVTKTYTGESLEAIKKEHPDARKALGEISWRVDPFGGFEKFFAEEWGRQRDEKFWTNEDSNLKREIERLRAWADRVADQQRRDAARGRVGRRQQMEGAKLGVRAHRPEPVLDVQLQLRGRGLVIDDIVRDSDAAKLGLARHDILLELNGSAVRGFADVGTALRGRDENAPLLAKVLRRGKTVDLKLTR